MDIITLYKGIEVGAVDAASQETLDAFLADGWTYESPAEAAVSTKVSSTAKDEPAEPVFVPALAAFTPPPLG